MEVPFSEMGTQGRIGHWNQEFGFVVVTFEVTIIQVAMSNKQ